MTYPRHWRLRIEGTLGRNPENQPTYASSEWWSTGVNIGLVFNALPGVPNAEELADLGDEDDYLHAQGLNFARALISTAWTSENVTVKAIKLNEIGPDGHYSDETVTHALYEVDFGSEIRGQSSAHLPFQVAEVVSLRTAILRGPAHAGRMYLPGPAYQIDADGRIPAADQAQHLTSLTSAFEQLGSNPLIPGHIFGAVVVSGIGTGSRQAVTHLRLGRVLDTIRSRRRSLVEAYVDGATLDYS